MTTDNLIPLNLKEKYWVVSADMGYGHQRAVYPLRDLAPGRKILNANTSPSARIKELRIWKELKATYEFMSRSGRVPVIGGMINRLLDRLLYIPGYNPLKDMSSSTFQVKSLKISIKNGLCAGIMEQIGNSRLPIITSFYTSAIAAEMADYENVYCIICDTDLNRVWAAEQARRSRIIYFASGTVSAHRLHSYGVPEKNIVLTGFPLPVELLGNRDLDTLRINLSRRLRNLDPDGLFYGLHKHSVNAFLQNNDANKILPAFREKPVTITYTVGGAGAQKEIGRQIAHSLSAKIRHNQVKLNLVAGIRTELRDFFLKVKEEIAVNTENVQVIWANDNESYFDLFNNCLHSTDILWTKPSELSFYCALGIPIIMTPAIGPQEKCNRRWLLETGAGFKQQDPEETNIWLFELLKKGRLAEAAWNGFLKARKYGTYNILDFLETGAFVSSNDPLRR